MIEQARAKQQASGLTNLTWLVGDAVPLPFADASFTAVVARYSFHHVPGDGPSGDVKWGAADPTDSPEAAKRAAR
jgi:hypothetical protein